VIDVDAGNHVVTAGFHPAKGVSVPKSLANMATVDAQVSVQAIARSSNHESVSLCDPETRFNAQLLSVL
jgi:hypothetical protein